MKRVLPLRAKLNDHAEIDFANALPTTRKVPSGPFRGSLETSGLILRSGSRLGDECGWKDVAATSTGWFGTTSKLCSASGNRPRNRSLSLMFANRGRAPRVLRRQPHVELNFSFVFGSDARFSGRLDSEVAQLHGSLAGVAAVLQRHFHRHRPRLPS